MLNMQMFHNALFSAKPTGYMNQMERLTEAKPAHFASRKPVPGWIGWDE